MAQQKNVSVKETPVQIKEEVTRTLTLSQCEKALDDLDKQEERQIESIKERFHQQRKTWDDRIKKIKSSLK